MGEDCATFLVIARTDMEKEADGVDFEPGIRFLSWRITPHYGSQFVYPKTSGDDPDAIIYCCTKSLAHILKVYGPKHISSPNFI